MRLEHTHTNKRKKKTISFGKKGESEERGCRRQGLEWGQGLH